jgi:hypothetical protein
MPVMHQSSNLNYDHSPSNPRICAPAALQPEIMCTTRPPTELCPTSCLPTRGYNTRPLIRGYAHHPPYNPSCAYQTPSNASYAHQPPSHRVMHTNRPPTRDHTHHPPSNPRLCSPPDLQPEVMLTTRPPTRGYAHHPTSNVSYSHQPPSNASDALQPPSNPRLSPPSALQPEVIPNTRPPPTRLCAEAILKHLLSSKSPPPPRGFPLPPPIPAER